MEKIVDRAARVFLICRRNPPATIFFRVCFDSAQRQELLQPLELACYDDAVGKGAEEADCGALTISHVIVAALGI